ncbi:MAG: D-tyrosyl-tRNA(Tyr) deacylase [Chloroflexi bacterium]|nr:D-tyrosyl-tRNA(Tyr) deacylase [Chloroflexota bacterium]
MRALLQRVRRATVSVGGETIGEIGPGLAILLGVSQGDGHEDARYLAEKSAFLRIFSDAQGKFNFSLVDIGGEALVVSQFTLYADARKGRRPSFTEAAPPALAAPLVAAFVAHLRAQGLRVAEGRFRKQMLVEIHNDGPVTVMLESQARL